VVSSTARPYFTPGKDPVLILQEAAWAPMPVCTGGKSRPHRDSILDRPARSQWLYRLSYRAHRTLCTKCSFTVRNLHISCTLPLFEYKIPKAVNTALGRLSRVLMLRYWNPRFQFLQLHKCILLS